MRGHFLAGANFCSPPGRGRGWVGSWAEQAATSHPSFRWAHVGTTRNLLPLPARNEWGEGRDEGCSIESASSPRPSPPPREEREKTCPGRVVVVSRCAPFSSVSVWRLDWLMKPSSFLRAVLPDGVTVAQQTLDLFVLVQIQVGQPTPNYDFSFALCELHPDLSFKALSPTSMTSCRRRTLPASFSLVRVFLRFIQMVLLH